jgi:multidrug efflux pump subunit AcrA (membrane-fusion protein)
MSYHRFPVRFLPDLLLAALLVYPVSVLTAEKKFGTEKRASSNSEEKRASSSSEKKSEGLPTHTLSRGALKTKTQLDAVLESEEMKPIKIEPKTWSDLTVKEALPHGARVKKGDTLVTLETEKIKDQIEDLEQERPGAKIALELGLVELDNLNESTPQKLESAKRSQRVANEEFAYFEGTNRVQREKSARFNLKGAEQRLENALEELKQLEKMYKADDLTEETEEIILKRQKYAVEMAEFFLQGAQLNADRDLTTLIPREYETLKSQKRDQDVALALAEESLPRNLAKKRLDVEKMKRDQKKAEKKLTDLKNDLEMLTVRAPMDGMVYYGACENGKWTSGASVAKKLIPTGKLSANEVFMTIVNPEKLSLKAIVPENELSHYKTGLKGKASPVSAPEKKLPVKLEEIGYVPLPSGGFEATLSVQLDKDLRLMPGMTCKVSFAEAEKSDSLLAPKEAVFSEGDQSHVFLVNNGSEPRKQVVKTGKSDDKMIEILEGLSEGDKISLKKPE